MRSHLKKHFWKKGQCLMHPQVVGFPILVLLRMQSLCFKTTETPTRILSGCVPEGDCNFSYDQDLLCPHPRWTFQAFTACGESRAALSAALLATRLDICSALRWSVVEDGGQKETVRRRWSFSMPMLRAVRRMWVHVAMTSNTPTVVGSDMLLLRLITIHII